MMPQIIFLSVKDSAAKLSIICQIATQHFEHKESLLFLLPDREAIDYIDKLLWKYPENSFLPHPNEYIRLSEEEVATPFLFNLRATAPKSFEGIKKIYELEDLSSPQKQELVKKKYDFYKNLGFPLQLT